MGKISKQAISNSIYSVIGIIAGAINTIYILPRAFEESPDNLGLVRIILAYATIFGSIFGLGVYNLIFNELTEEKTEEYKKSVLGYGLLLSFIGLSILVIALVLFPSSLSYIINSEEAHRLIPNAYNIILLAFVIIFSQYLNSYIISKHKSPFVQFIKDPFLKISYLILSLVYLLHPFSFDLFLNLFIWIYTFSVFLLFIYALRNKYSINFNFKILDKARLFWYGMYTVLDKGISMIVNNLDLIMIGYIMNLSNVGYYSIAFFMGAVIIVPQKAILTPSYPLVSNFLKQNKTAELKKLYQQSSINQFIIGGALFTLLWVNIDDVFALMPPNFAPGKWVVFYIGLSKLFVLISGTSGPMILFSKHYRYNVIFNLILVVITIASNSLLIPIYGITGAAIATAITFGIYSVLRILFVKKKFGIQPITISSIKTFVILTAMILIGISFNFSYHPLINITIKSAIIGVISLLAFRLTNVEGEILELIPFFKKKENQ